VKDASLKAPPSTNGVVIEKKLFARAKKEKSAKSDEKVRIAKLEESHNKVIASLKNILVEKLFAVVNGKTSQGVYNIYNEELIPKGVKFTQKQLLELNYDVVNASGWTTDKAKNELVRSIINNFKMKANEEIASFKRDMYALSVGDELPSGILKMAKVYIATKRKLKVGDKMAGRHGNKGIVARIEREENMPFMEDGKPVDVVLNPLGVPSRMNLGQIYETVLGWAGKELGLKFATPIFDGAKEEDILKYVGEAGIPENGQTYLYDGLTGDRFHQKTTVGIIYILKLGHMVDDKMHARSIGPY
jgi:DNA-directed RNA polymerase subunit beta